LEWSRDSAVTVVVASEGYPAAPRTGAEIHGIAEAEADRRVHVLHAGTAVRDGQLVTAGGRVLAVTATGSDLDEARSAAYAAVDRIDIRGSHHRRDIAARAARAEITVP